MATPCITVRAALSGLPGCLLARQKLVNHRLRMRSTASSRLRALFIHRTRPVANAEPASACGSMNLRGEISIASPRADSAPRRVEGEHQLARIEATAECFGATVWLGRSTPGPSQASGGSRLADPGPAARFAVPTTGLVRSCPLERLAREPRNSVLSRSVGNSTRALRRRDYTPPFGLRSAIAPNREFGSRLAGSLRA